MSDSKKQRILLVDDDRDIVDSTRLRLKNAGFETIVAYGGQQGLDAAIEDRPDAILLDVHMPVMNGLETLAELKKHNETKDIPVVMLSASLVHQKPCLDAGARFFVTKPYISSNLIEAIHSAMSELPVANT
jgi:CheY-like chemotaxis protein